jgi:hypothetical protein
MVSADLELPIGESWHFLLWRASGYMVRLVVQGYVDDDRVAPSQIL